MAKIFDEFVEGLHSLARLFKVPLWLEYITPEDAREMLKANSALLAKYGKSQMMKGDTSESGVILAKGRPFAAELAERIRAGRWRWYMGVMSRCKNGAWLDGVTRLIAITMADEGVWVLTYNDANPEDFYMYDSPKSGRDNGDVFTNMGKNSSDSAVLGAMLPKVLEAFLADECDKVTRDEWINFYQQHTAASSPTTRPMQASA